MQGRIMSPNPNARSLPLDEVATHPSGPPSGADVNDQFRLLVESVVDYAIFMLDREGRVTSWNKGAEAFKGYTACEILGQSYSRFYLPEDIEKGLPQTLLKIATEKGRVEHEGWRMRKDGTLFWADVVITALRDASGNLTGFAKITRDLTQRKESEMLKDQFLSVLSHELRTPINAITGFGSILEDGLAGPLTDEQLGYLRKMLQGADTLLALVDDLLDMSRVQSGKFSIETAIIDLGEVITDALSSLAPLAEQKHQRFVREIPADLPQVEADAQRVGQILLNLVNNAIKFSGDGGVICVRALVEGDHLRCEVQDQGPGIAEDDLPRLFQRFMQLDMGTTRPVGGVGLGLSICKALIEAHGGQIGVTSTPGIGSTFWFTLPLCQPPSRSANTEPSIEALQG